MLPRLLRLRQELSAHADETIRETGKRFFKKDEVIQCYGVKTKQVTLIAKKWLVTLKVSSKKEIFALCEELWSSGYMEESFIACEWAYAQRKAFEPKDFVLFEHWVDAYVKNWAACDTLCNHTVGDLVIMFPDLVQQLKGWAASENRWKKRAAAVTLIIPARKGLFLEDVFDIADRLLTDKDDLVQKGYGWMLKAASEAHQQPVFDYLMERRDRMPRTAFRYALEKMPKPLRKQAMQKR